MGQKLLVMINMGVYISMDKLNILANLIISELAPTLVVGGASYF